MRGWLVALAMLAAPAFAADRYVTTTDTCDGYPRAPIVMARGMCAGLVIAPPENFATRQLKFPRLLLQISYSDWLVTDLVAWGAKNGKVFRLTALPGQPALLK